MNRRADLEFTVTAAGGSRVTMRPEKCAFLPYDTSLNALRAQFRVYRGMSPERKLRLAFDLSRGLRSRMETGVRQRHPEWSEEDVRLETIRLWIGDELFEKAYGKGAGK